MYLYQIRTTLYCVLRMYDVCMYKYVLYIHTYIQIAPLTSLVIPNWVINSLLGKCELLMDNEKCFFFLEPHKLLPSWLNEQDTAIHQP